MSRHVRAAARRAGPAGLVVLFKAPDRAKRRLASTLGAAAPVAAEHLLACALEDARAWMGEVVFAAAEQADADWFARTGNPTGHVIVQHGDTLGERIQRIDTELRSHGLERLIYIGADCPALDLVYLTRADIALGRVDAVLGSAIDGGVVLMGARRPWPDIANLPWSTAELRVALAAQLERRGWTTTTLAALRDVDEPTDLAALIDELAGDTRAARIALTRWLSSQQQQRVGQP